MNEGSGSAVGGAQPGELMRLIAEGMTGKGLALRSPEPEHGGHLIIEDQGAWCTLLVDDTGNVELACSPAKGGKADPQEVADLAAVLLTGRAGGHPRQDEEPERSGLTLRGAVGRELRARGLKVALEVYPDELAFEAFTEISVTDPGASAESEVFISEDGGLTWERDYWPEAAVIGWEPAYHWWIADPVNLAGDIVARVVQAISQGLPGRRGAGPVQPAPGVG
ncbi:MAG TPA: hypothetical protein VGI74_15290 [Streptosporangiaceae bacterium]